jgi:hypothetical protein
MNNCKTCRYWAVSLVVLDGKADCDRVNCINKDKSKTFEIQATAWDVSGLEAVLITGESFGCTLHEPKN